MRKIGLLLFFIALSANCLVAQDKDGGYPEWIQQMLSSRGNLEQARESFEKMRKSEYKVKGSGWKKFARWHYYYAPRISKEGRIPSDLEKLKTYRDYYTNHTKSREGAWEPLGPKFLPAASTNQPNGMGRLNAIAFHPQDADIIYVGAPSGGLWQTTNGGLTWESFTDSLPTLGVSSILVHPDNPSILYMGTGDRDAGDAPGVGVMKSYDAGKTWSLANNGMGEVTVGMMRMHPENPAIILAATNKGVFKTTDAGRHWYRTSPVKNFRDMELHPAQPDTVYATAEGMFYRSLDNGETWTDHSDNLEPNDRMVIGVSPDDPDVVYCLLSSYTDAFVGLYKSTNSGNSFAKKSSIPNILGYYTDGSDGANQAFYDLCIAVDPENADIIYGGGINIWKSENSGKDWNIVTHWYGGEGHPAVHADQHALVFSPVDGRLYSGNDGGIHYSGDGGETWNDISSGLAISQAYKMGQSSTDASLIINGYQDNGTAKHTENGWHTVIGGDGMECIIDYSDDDYQYGSTYYGRIYRTTTGGSNMQAIAGNGVNGIDEEGGWVTPYVLDAEHPGVMYAGYSNLWRTKNVKAGNTSLIDWKRISNLPTEAPVDAIEQSPANTDVLYLAVNDKLFRTDDLQATNPSWVDLSAHIPFPGNYITAVETHPYKEQVVYLVTSGDVFKSTDKGKTWQNFSGSLPDVFFNSLVYDAFSHEGLYLGSNIGVFYRNKSMTDWEPFSRDLPVVDVRELEIYYNTDNYSNSRIRAATYGRGTWESPLHESSGVKPVADFFPDDSTLFVGETVQLNNTSALGAKDFSWSVYPENYTYVKSTGAFTENPALRFTAPGTYSISLVASNNLGSGDTIKEDIIRVTDSIPMHTNNLTLCQGYIFDSGGDTSSYQDNEEKVLTLMPTEDSLRIRLIFDSFNLEETETCNADFLEIYNGPSRENELIGRFCGEQMPDTLEATHLSGALTLYFKSDGSRTAPGWSARAECGKFSLKAGISVDKREACTNDTVVFIPEVIGNPKVYKWDFGADASPAKAEEGGRQKVVYHSGGAKTVALTLVDTLEDGSVAKSFMEYEHFMTIYDTPVAAFSFDTNGLIVDFYNESLHAESYTWYFGDGKVSALDNPRHEYETDSLFKVKLKASSAQCGISEYEQYVEVNDASGVPEPEEKDSLFIAPNPARTSFNLYNYSGHLIKRIIISSSLGDVLMERLLETSVPREKVHFDVSAFNQGIYNVEVVFSDDTKLTRKVLVL